MSRFSSLTNVDGFSSSIQTGGVMERFTSYFNMKTLIFIGAFVLFIIIAVIFYNKFISPKLNSSASYPEDGGSSSTSQVKGHGEAELLFFYTTWCPHCKTAKPVWEELKAEYETKPIKGTKVIFTEVDCTNENAEVENLMNKFKVEGFPTIKLIHNGQVIEYDAKPSKETLVEFLNTVL
jgi:thiol-disulfide isomerase/thioredoxin